MILVVKLNCKMLSFFRCYLAFRLLSRFKPYFSIIIPVAVVVDG